MPLPWRLAWPLHDCLCQGRDALAWGQPRARLASPACLAERAIAGGRAHDPAGGCAHAAWLLGFAGQFWRPWRPLAAPSREAFVAWRVPQSTRVVWLFSVQGSFARTPLGHAAGEHVSLQMVLRARSQDTAARRAFARYMRLVGPVSRALRGRLLWDLARSCGMPPC